MMRMPIWLHNILPGPTVLIVGYGFVGKVIAQSLLQDNFIITTLDKDQSFDEFYAEDCAIVCVDTPTVDGFCDTTNVEDALAMLEKEMPGKPIMLKSTVPPEFVATLPDNVVYSPEFMRDGNAYHDFRHQPFMLLGSNNEKQTKFWKKIFRCLETEFVEVTPEAASWAKYIHNAFLASKVTFFHELDRVADEMHIDSKLDKEHFLQAIGTVAAVDTQIGSSHLFAPNLDGVYGYGGMCFPKDMQAFQSWTHSPYIRQIIRHNEKLNGKRPKY